MGEPVARQRTASRESPGVTKLDARPADARGGHHDGEIKVDQAGVVDTVPLRTVHAVCIMAGTARRPQVDDVAAMQREALVSQNTLTAVTLITQGVSLRTLHGEVRGLVIAHQQGFIHGTVRAVGSRPAGEARAVAIVTIHTGNNGAHAKRSDQTHYVAVAPGPGDRMERRIGRLELETRVGLLDLALNDWSALPGDAVRVAFETNLIQKP